MVVTVHLWRLEVKKTIEMRGKNSSQNTNFWQTDKENKRSKGTNKTWQKELHF